MSLIKTILLPALVALIAAPAVASANSVTYFNYGAVDLTLVFTPNCFAQTATTPRYCLMEYDNLNVPANTPNNGINGGVVQVFDVNWAGNFFTFPTGSPGVYGVLGEMSFPAGGNTCYDTSTIVIDQMNIVQENGVHFYFPKYGNGGNRVSGCPSFPCPYCYSGNPTPGYHATCCTLDVDLMSYLGEGSPSPPGRSSSVEGREFRA